MIKLMKMARLINEFVANHPNAELMSIGSSRNKDGQWTYTLYLRDENDDRYRIKIS